MTPSVVDVIDHLVGIEPGSPLDVIRARRAQARENAQASFVALFEPTDFNGVTAQGRYAVATFVAALHRDSALSDFYAARLGALDGGGAIVAAIASESEAGGARGPYGHYPAGPLSAEDRGGPVYRVGQEGRNVLGPRLASAFEHAHMLVFRPRDASAAALQTLLGAGWTTTEIVTLSQLVAFLSFQIRVIGGLRTLAAGIKAGVRA